VQSAKTSAGLPKGLLFGGLAVVLLAGGGGAAYWFLRPAPVVATSALDIAAVPYGEVVSITSDKGKAVVLPAGEHWTPMRLDGLTPGAYSVVVKGSDGNTQTQSCTAAQTPQVCTVSLQQIDDKTLDEIVGGSK
jgi:serine/threonine-protein kinase